MNRNLWKLLIVIGFLASVGLVYFFELHYYFTLESLKEHHETLVSYYDVNTFIFLMVFFLLYVFSVAVSIPGATVLTLAAGSIMGLAVGTIFVSFASTIGATLAFLVARFLFRDFVQEKFAHKLGPINVGIKKEGAFYLFSLRLVPVFPFFLINLLTGLTSLKTSTFFIASQVGMLPGTIVYINAGTQLAQIERVGDILSPGLIGSFLMIAIFPWISRFMLKMIKNRRYLKQFKKPKNFDYNMIVIGGGAAGLVSSYIAAAVKAKVLLVEREKMGGDCLNTGCVPSKAIIRSAKALFDMRNAKRFGHSSERVSSDFKKVMQRVHQVIKKIEPHDSVERYEGMGVDCISGEAFIKSPYEVEVNGKIYTGKNIIIATGAAPVIPQIPGLDQVTPQTSETLWKIESLPKKFVVLGGGPIGCEMAQAFSRLGAEVTLIEKSDRLMQREDSDVSEFVQKNFREEGIEVLTSHKAISFEKDGEIKRVKCNGPDGEKMIEFDEVLLSLGRKARVIGFGLEELDVEINQDGTIAVDEFMRTTRYPNIYACGDVAGPFQFTHTAAYQAWFACVNALFSPLKKFKVDYRVIPWCTFVSPEVARVGLSEDDAKSKGINVDVTIYGIDDLDRAIADGSDQGFVKVLTAKGGDKILGVTIVGDHAGDIIAEYVLAMKYGIGLNKILGTIHIYPTLSEANKFAAGEWKKANAPERILSWLKKYHRWRRA